MRSFPDILKSFGRRVLIVDEDESVFKDLISMFQNKNIYLDITPDPDEALDFLIKNEYSAVLAEIVIPKLSGLDLLKKVRAYRTDLPFVFFTHHAHESHMIQALRLGATDFVSKNVKTSSLHQKLLQIIEIGEIQKDIERLFEKFADRGNKEREFVELIRQKRREVLQIRNCNA